MSHQPAFRPEPAGTVSLAVTSTTGRVSYQAGRNARHVRLYNAGTAGVFVEVGDSTVTAAVATGYPLAAGAVEIISGPFTHVAAITASGTATLYATPGNGI